jgi:hypothetical protein
MGKAPKKIQIGGVPDLEEAFDVSLNTDAFESAVLADLLTPARRDRG